MEHPLDSLQAKSALGLRPTTCFVLANSSPLFLGSYLDLQVKTPLHHVCGAKQGSK